MNNKTYNVFSLLILFFGLLFSIWSFNKTIDLQKELSQNKTEIDLLNINTNELRTKLLDVVGTSSMEGVVNVRGHLNIFDDKNPFFCISGQNKEGKELHFLATEEGENLIWTGGKCPLK